MAVVAALEDPREMTSPSPASRDMLFLGWWFGIFLSSAFLPVSLLDILSGYVCPDSSASLLSNHSDACSQRTERHPTAEYLSSLVNSCVASFSSHR